MNRKAFTLLGILILVLTACTQQWSFTIKSSFDEAFQVDQKLLETYTDYVNKDDTQCTGIPLEVVLYQNGIEVIESMEIMNIDGRVSEFNKRDLIEDLCVNLQGEIIAGGNAIQTESMLVNEYDLVQDGMRIQDITATTAQALDLEMEGLHGAALYSETYKHVALIFLDGFSYKTYEQASSESLIPNIESNAVVLKAVSVYPPRTTTASAAVLTGLTPNENGVNKSGIRNTEARTIFDAAMEKGLTSIAIEGESLAFNLRNATSLLSGDRDNNGATDDNTFDNAMGVLSEGMPNLIWIHFHGIDDLGHAYGPITDEVLDKVVEIDAYVGQIYKVLPENTLIIIFSDHGMHYEEEGEGFGNHGNLIYEDMVIPIIIKAK